MIAPWHDSICLDLQRLGFASISQTTALAQVLKDSRSSGIGGRIINPPDAAYKYMQRMNFYRLIGIGREEDFMRHDPGDRFIPIETLEDESSPGTIADKVTAMVRKLAPYADISIPGTLGMAFGEIMDNAVHHSETPTPGIAAAQYYPNRKFIEFCVADGGKGIVASLRDNQRYARFSDEQLAEMAFEANVGQFVGVPDYSHDRASMGRGLYIAAQVTRKLNGHLWLYSRDRCIALCRDGTESLSGFFYPGTLIVMRLPIQAGVKVLGSDIDSRFKASPVSWDVMEGGMYYTEENDDTSPLW